MNISRSILKTISARSSLTKTGRGTEAFIGLLFENAGNERKEPEEKNSQQFRRDDVDDKRDVFETRDVDDESNIYETITVPHDEGESELSDVLSRDTVELRTAASDGNGNDIDSDISDVISRAQRDT